MARMAPSWISTSNALPAVKAEEAPKQDQISSRRNGGQIPSGLDSPEGNGDQEFGHIGPLHSGMPWNSRGVLCSFLAVHILLVSVSGNMSGSGHRGLRL